MSNAAPLSSLATGAAASTFVTASRSASARPDPVAVAEMQQEIRVLVQEVAQLAQSEMPADEFFAAFLTRVVSAMGAIGGVVWIGGEGGRLQIAFQINVAQSGLDTIEARPRHSALLLKALAGKEALLVPPSSGTAGDETGNPCEHLLVLAPLVVEKQPQGIIEIFQRPGGGPTTQRGYLRFLIQMGDLACDFLKNRRLAQLEENQSLWQQLEQFVQAIHASLDVQATSFALVNEGRRLIGCDRVSLALRYGSHCRIEAVSGLDSVERRASEVKRLAELAQAVLQTGEPLWHAGENHELAPQIESPLTQYVDSSHARLVAVLPLLAQGNGGSTDDAGERKPIGRPLGTIIVEQLRDARATEALRTRSQLVAQHGGQALARAIDHSSLFLLPLWRALGKATWVFRGRTLPKTLLLAGAIAGGVAALVTVQTDFEIAARGKLQPAVRREVFAPIDGIVQRVAVRHGQDVTEGAILVELANTNLELELAALIGRQTTNQEQIASHQRALLDNSTAAGVRLTPAEESRLSGELMQLRQEAQNIESELVLFHEKQKQLVITAGQPGQVITWKVEDLLQGRPVIRGQALLTLANPAGPWELELYVPERRLAHVQAAQAQLSQTRRDSTDSNSARQPLDVVFTLTSHPGSQFRGRVVEIERTAEVRGDEGNTVLVRVAIDKDLLPALHDQTTVTAKLYCGRTSVGFAWFCDLIETVQSKVLFWMP